MTDTAVAPEIERIAFQENNSAPEPVGNPGVLGLPLIIAGALGLGFTNTGIIGAGSAAVPILLSATTIGLLLTTIWSAALRQNVNVTVYGVFFGFYGSYAVLSLGFTHDWFGIPSAAVGDTTALWLGSWQLTIGRALPPCSGHGICG